MSAPATGQPLDRPAVGIRLAGAVPADTVRAIGWGLEEEGIPFAVESAAAAASVGTLAHQAARRSRLGVGLGVCQHTGRAALQHRDMPPEHPLMVLALAGRPQADLMRLGANAARLVKGNPLNLGDASPSPSADGTVSAARDAIIERIVTEVVRALSPHLPHR